MKRTLGGFMHRHNVRDLVEAYLRHSQATGLHGREAFEERQRILIRFAEHVSDVPISDLRPYHLSDWIERNPKWQSVSTRRAKANMVRACFAWAATQERIAKNPFVSVRYAEAERRPEMPDVCLSRIAALGNKPFERMVRWLRMTGCRLGEACEATWGDVDLDRGLWYVRRHKSRRFTQRDKVVVLVDEAVALLRELAALTASAGAGGPVLAQGMPTDTPIFVNTLGRPWNRHTLGQQLRRLKGRHGIDCKATLHGIRHRLASAAIGNGASVKLVAEQLGHASTVITERYYFHRTAPMNQAIREAVAKGLPGGQ